MYSLWNDHFHNVEGYIRHGYPMCTPMTFNTGNRGLTDKFKLEELDALTTQYKDDSDFLENLSKYGQNYIKNHYYPVITMTHSKGNRVYQDDIIYKDLMVHEVSREIIYKKQNKEADTEVFINESEKMDEFIEYIKGLALNKYSRKYLLEPYTNHFDLEEARALDKLVDGDVVKDNIVIKKGLKGFLSDYVFKYKIYQGCIEAGESTLEVEMDLDKINRKISDCIRGDYRVFRNLIAWENRFVKILENAKETSSVKDKKIEYSKLLAEIKVQKQFRNNLISSEVLHSFYRDLDCMFEEEAEFGTAFTENEELTNAYQHGGIEEVMNNFDLDDIYGSKKNYDDAVKLGIIKGKK